MTRVVVRAWVMIRVKDKASLWVRASFSYRVKVWLMAKVFFFFLTRAR